MERPRNPRWGINRKDLRAEADALETWRVSIKGKLVLDPMDNSAAVTYANFGVGRSLLPTTLARRIKEFEISWQRPLAAF